MPSKLQTPVLFTVMFKLLYNETLIDTQKLKVKYKFSKYAHSFSQGGSHSPGGSQNMYNHQANKVWLQS